MKRAMCSRRDFLKAAGVGVTVGSLLPRWLEGAVEGGAPGRRPNIIVILCDDVGYECIGAYGCQSYKTPNLDKLAATGVRFDHGYAQPLCTPTRVQMMTGIYNVRNYTHFGHMDPSQTTFAQLLKKAGYATCMTGKWQLAGDETRPKDLGFDEYTLWQHTRRPPRYANPGLEINGVKKDFTNGEYGPELINSAALDFISRHKDRPFFLYYTELLAHAPFQPTPDSSDWDPKAAGEQVHNNVSHFADNIAYMDKMVGRLLAKLDELKLRDNTLILFMGDNGTGKGVVTRMADGTKIIGGKGASKDAGTHVPLIASYPAATQGGLVCKDLVDSTDFLPTVCEAAGVPVPAELKIDGHSFLPQIKGEKGTPREWTYCWFSQNGGPKASKEFARNQRYKLYADGSFFDMSADPLEQKALDSTALTADARAAHQLLQSALDQYKNARPAKFAQQAGKGGGE